MKHFIFTCCLAAAIFSLNSCNEEEVAPAPEKQPSGELCTFTVNAGSNITRTDIAGTSSENTINSLQVFVFRRTSGSDNGMLDAYAQGTSSSQNITCPVGDKTIYALVNAPDMSSVKTLSALKDQKVYLENDSRAKFQMSGFSDCAITVSTTSVSVDVLRFASRVRVGSIVFNTTDAAYSSSSFKLKSLYLVNVPRVYKVSRSYTPQDADYVNKSQFASSSCDALVKVDISGTTLSSGSTTYSTSQSLYAYPNPSTVTDTPSPWVPVCTRLVLEAELDDVTYYYPINIPGMEANHTYEITTLTVTRPGSASPDIPVTFRTCPVTVTVKNWESVNITDGITV